MASSDIEESFSRYFNSTSVTSVVFLVSSCLCIDPEQCLTMSRQLVLGSRPLRFLQNICHTPVCFWLNNATSTICLQLVAILVEKDFAVDLCWLCACPCGSSLVDLLLLGNSYVQSCCCGQCQQLWRCCLVSGAHRLWPVSQICELSTCSPSLSGKCLQVCSLGLLYYPIMSL